MSTSTKNDKIGHEAPERGLREATLHPSAREKSMIFQRGLYEEYFTQALKKN
ncbi:hypothetical protein L313_1807 [Acinetobacter haemolyticus CIP 64.3 = MTCC 9819]|uniref:Uncharacterized protein n=1 Tax=Acinetobacter haemolyticus ATCC 19194 TaxID=707232 RepID=D4XNA9_ACIHA|nr:hypothetical protein HMPREF0023_2268 [Acinetobacter sp. ATCC 27244]EFF83342.1 hypothetical protein HMP0015_1201 [Acinetobacter haemolyticus ATCC 19194]EPR89091.1 hypothetical protein L313_1807 [Acinetobacter haemolyticus CIP 64.3 = MTCC 9819]